jgi:hypothetical protein
LQFYSFDAKDPVYEVGGWRLSFQVVTLENTYGLDPEQTIAETRAGSLSLDCRRLSWAGQQQRAEGRFRATATTNERGQLELRMEAEAPHKIRCVKVLVRGLGEAEVLDPNSRRGWAPASPDGDLYSYPNGLSHGNKLRTPVLLARSGGGGTLAFRCEDPKVREKRFAVYRERTGEHRGTFTVELIHEESASRFDTRLSVPLWVLGRGEDPDLFHDEYLAFAESDRGLGLVPWDERADLPGWAKGIALSLTLHGMHWSGYAFNTYEQMLQIIRHVARRIEGDRVLAYLPGWEGRYYWQYGEYRPEPRLGGEEGFAELCRGARELGVHVMPMFGGNCANAWLPNFHEYGPGAHMKTATRNRFHGNTPDWDISRAHDPGWQAWLNPGSPSWRRELVRQVGRLADEYGFDAVFLDTLQSWTNDPDFDVYEGVRALKAEIAEGRPDLLVVAENWYDALLGVFPFFQDEPFGGQPPWVGRYARVLAHLLEAEPSRGSTGVHELGHRPYERKPPEEAGIPTIAFVDGTFERSRDELDEVIEQALRYEERFLRRELRA